MLKSGYWSAIAVMVALAACGDDDTSANTETLSDASAREVDASDLHDASSRPDEGVADAQVDASGDEDASSIDAALADAGTDAAVDAGVDAGPPVSYAAQVQPIFDKYCVSCHSLSGTGPFSLDTYMAAFPRGAGASAAAAARLMPPCAESDPSCGPTDDELAVLRRWVQQGRPGPD